MTKTLRQLNVDFEAARSAFLRARRAWSREQITDAEYRQVKTDYRTADAALEDALNAEPLPPWRPVVRAPYEDLL